MAHETQALLWFCIVIAVLIAAPLIARAIRKRDFEKQVRGDKPERKLKENDPALFRGKEQEDINKELLKKEAWERSKSNFFGPH